MRIFDRFLTIPLQGMIRRELISLLRRPSSTLLLATAFLITAAFVYSAYPAEGTPLTYVAAMSRYALYSLLLGLVVSQCALLPLMVAGAIAAEFEDKTMEQLYMSAISPRDVVLGKLISASGLVLLIVIGLLPIPACVFFFVGQDAWLIATTLLVVIVAGIAVALECIRCGCEHTSSVQAIRSAYSQVGGRVFIVALLFGPIIFTSNVTLALFVLAVILAAVYFRRLPRPRGAVKALESRWRSIEHFTSPRVPPRRAFWLPPDAEDPRYPRVSFGDRRFPLFRLGFVQQHPALIHRSKHLAAGSLVTGLVLSVYVAPGALAVGFVEVTQVLDSLAWMMLVPAMVLPVLFVTQTFAKDRTDRMLDDLRTTLLSAREIVLSRVAVTLVPLCACLAGVAIPMLIYARVVAGPVLLNRGTGEFPMTHPVLILVLTLLTTLWAVCGISQLASLVCRTRVQAGAVSAIAVAALFLCPLLLVTSGEAIARHFHWNTEIQNAITYWGNHLLPIRIPFTIHRALANDLEVRHVPWAIAQVWPLAAGAWCIQQSIRTLRSGPSARLEREIALN